MKRCPQCLFLYPDSDSKCDFDQTPLEHVDDSAIETPNRPAKRRALPIAAAIGLMLGILVFAVYYGLSRQQQKVSAAPEPIATVEPVAQPLAATPSPEVSPLPSPSVAPSPRSSPEKFSTAHTRSTADPVSTSGPGIGTRQGGKPVIMLTSGGKIEADEVWRTKDGVWYRRNGMVTLLKRGQVKSISTR
jgi:hypothetical protein